MAEEIRKDRFTINFGGRTFENRWTRYRQVKLRSYGLSDYEIMAVKYNRMSNPRVAKYLRDIRREVKRIQRDFSLPDFQAAAQYRNDNYASLVDSGDIEEWDPYWRMGYYDID